MQRGVLSRSTVEHVWRQIRHDGWINTITGLGNVLRDKRRGQAFALSIPLSDSELENLYDGNDLAARVCELPVDEMMRSGFELTCDDSQQANALMARWCELGGHEAFVEGLTWGRLFGGGGVYVGVEDGLGEIDPLDPAKVKKVTFLTAFDRRDMQVLSYYEDPRAPKYGRPQLYRITRVPSSGPVTSSAAGGFAIHESRMLIFRGARTTPTKRRTLMGWDQSVLQRVHEVLQDFETTWGSVAHLMADVAQAVFKMRGFADQMAAGGGDVIHARMEMMDLARSTVRAVLLDADGEEFERKPTPLTGVPEVMQMFVLRFAAAARMPATIAFGQSPSGLNATGESDLRWFRDQCAAEREAQVKPQLRKLFAMLWHEQGGEPESWDICFKPLWTPTAKEQAEIENLKAESDVAYVHAQVLFPEEVALSRFGPGGWSAETRIDVEARETMLKLGVENAVDRLENPPEPIDPNAPKPEPDLEPEE